jgi:hypothetical protein
MPERFQEFRLDRSISAFYAAHVVTPLFFFCSPGLFLHIITALKTSA